MRRPVAVGGRIVIKVGSSSLVSPGGGLVDEAVTRTAAEVASTWKAGHPAVLVSSGAVASGMSALGLEVPPTDMAGRQVAAAVGQGRLMHRYAQAFEEHGMVAGQILLTRDVLAHRGQYLHARQALDRMLAEGIVPVVNENDTVVIDALRMGDNDRLAAIVSHLVGAAALVILTDTAGLFSSDPRIGEADFLHAVDHADDRLDDLAGSGPLGSGGVASKVEAARIAAWSRIPTIVAGSDSSVTAIAAGDEIGTWVEPMTVPLSARKLWIAFCHPPRGTVMVDEGAEAALVAGGRSLLPVGVVSIVGDFRAGDNVEVTSRDGRPVARGIARLDATALAERVGQRGGTAAIHRDDLVILAR